MENVPNPMKITLRLTQLYFVSEFSLFLLLHFISYTRIQFWTRCIQTEGSYRKKPLAIFNLYVYK